MQFDRAFYNKHGIKITEDPINRNKTAEQTRVELTLHKAVTGSFVAPQTAKSVEQAVEKYPNSEALKNYQYAAYLRTGQPDKALACLLNTVKVHPNYAFGLINLVNHYLEKKELNKASELLTEPYDVRRIEKEDFIHVSVFISYYQAVVRLAIEKNDGKMAEQYHRMMFDYDPKNDTVKALAGEIVGGRMKNMQKRMTPLSLRKIKVTEKAVLGWETNNKPPVFTHPEVQQLYAIDPDEMPESVIRQLLNLPRETFIKDLENVLADLIRRKQYHLNHDEWDPETMSFSYHALYFLTELRAYDSLPTVLNILRQDEAFLRFWFSDALNDFFMPTLYVLGNNQLPLLKAFVLENNNYYWSRELMTEMATQIALRQPERRAEILHFFNDIIQAHLAQPQNNDLIDSSFLGGMLNDMLNCQAVELEQEIVTLFQTGWISEGECGDLEEILKELHQPKEVGFSRIKPLPTSIFERYTGKFSDKVEHKTKTVDNSPNTSSEDAYQRFLMQQTLGKLFGQSALKDSEEEDEEDEDDYYRPQQETVKRTEPKIGRNDPCHCGSGKKYKKCHGA